MKKAVVFLYVLLAALVHGQSEITVYRADMPTYAGFKCRVYIDGKQQLALANGESGRIAVSSGTHTIYADLYTLQSNRLEFTAGSSAVTFTVTANSLREFSIARGGGSAPVYSSGGVEGSLVQAADKIAGSIPPNSSIAVVYISAQDREVSEFIHNELEFLLVAKGFRMIDRRELDIVRREQLLQHSGMVDDRQAISVGKGAGANIIITGEVTGSGDLRRLRLRALDTQTNEIKAMISEKY
ncbi:MAG: CsgG/HfaB family protein [Spirochaetaceae bacterium]|jgi:hypothetical protein|nr:CsgG/HfaB family protein [Spirochaetaceae bacterium]